VNPVTSGHQTRPSPPSRQRRQLLPDQGAFHRTSAPSPGRTPRFRLACVGSRGARHRCRCSRARGSRHCDPASGAFSPLEPPCVVHARRQAARPMAFRLDRAPLVDFCNQKQPASTPANRPIFVSWWNALAAARSPGPPPCSAEASPDDGIHHPRERMVAVAATPALAPFRDGTFRHRCKAREFDLE